LRYAWWLVALIAGCGEDPSATMPDALPVTPDAQVTCQPQSAVGSFYRRPTNPRIVAGRMFTDGKLDTAIADPDLRWDGSAWHIYYQTPHGTSFTQAGPQIIRHASSTDLATWSFDETPSLTVGDAGAWDATHTETPTVVFDPDAPADRRYLMLYSGASTTLAGHSFPAYAIGAAFSADGQTFTRVSAAESPKGKAGLVLTGADAYPGAGGALVADPEVVLLGGTYHLWFSSFACSGASCATIDAYGIGHATSTDGVHWTVDAAPIPSLLRASADKRSGGAQPTVVYDDVHCKWEMWLASDAPATENDNQPVEFNNMVGVWHATSTNGSTWSINYSFARDLVWDQSAQGERLGLMTGADVARKGTGRYLVYVGFDDQNVPNESFLPDRTQTGFRAGVMTLNLATRDAP
jgi:hypothetical protein